MKLIDFKSKNGKKTFGDLFFDEKTDFAEHLIKLRENMLQVEFPNNYILDIGWSNDFEIDGYFIIYLIKHFDWENPVYLGNAYNYYELVEEINIAMELIP